MSDNVNAFENYAFYECSSLSSVTMPASLTYIGYVAFYHCKALTVINFLAKLETIDTYAFEGCTSLTSINIPAKVKTIGDNAFYGCTKLASVYVNNSTPFTLGTSVFGNNASGRKIYVPSAAVSAYKSATNWSSYSGYIVAKS